MAVSAWTILIFTSRATSNYVTGHRTLTWAYQARPLFAILTQDHFFVVSSRAEARNVALQAAAVENRHYDGLHAQAAAAIVALIMDLDPRGARPSDRLWAGHSRRGSLELIDGLRARSARARVVAAEKIVWKVRNGQNAVRGRAETAILCDRR